MGFRFRKSINLGGFRINLSKSGIGYSFGVRGLRFTHKAGGGTRTSIGIPGTGLSYVKDHSTHKQSQKKPVEKQVRAIPVEEEIEEELVESSNSEMIDRLNRAEKLDKIFRTCRILFPILALMCFSVFFAIVSNGMKLSLETEGGLKTIDGTALAIVCGIFSAVFLGGSIFFFLQKVKIDLSYEFSEDAAFEQNYSALVKGLATLQTAEKIWEKREDVSRERAVVTFVPKESYINTDLETAEMKLLRKKILFLPDIIAVKQQNGWVGVRYDEVEVAMQEEPTDETAVLGDATVLSERWLHARKDGGRNMQFQDNNYMIYQCLYERLTLSSKKGLNVALICSSDKKAQAFLKALSSYITFMKE